MCLTFLCAEPNANALTLVHADVTGFQVPINPYQMLVGIGLDDYTTNCADNFSACMGVVGTISRTCASITTPIENGVHKLYWIERTDAAGFTEWWGGDEIWVQAGIVGWTCI
jgi:hypothetical protein